MVLRAPSNQVKYDAVSHPGPVILWAWASDGSRCFHSNFFIRVPIEINTHFVTTFLTPEGESDLLD